MILMDVGADGQIQTADPPFFQIFLNSDPTGGAVREFTVLGAAAVDQGGEYAVRLGGIRAFQKNGLAVAHIYKSNC